MQKYDFIKKLNTSTQEIFIDTVKGRHPANEIIPVKGRWKWDNKRKYHYAPGLPFLKATAKLLFKKHKDKPYDGNVFCEFSAPKVLYGHNVCGILNKNIEALFRKPKELLTDYSIDIDLAAIPVDFRNFDVTRIDLSFCFFPKDDDEQQEFLRLFRNMYFENLTPGKSCSEEYDYENGFAHTSQKLDIVMYDKVLQLHNEDPGLHIEDINLLRIEFRCKGPCKGDVYWYGNSFEYTVKKANGLLAKKLERYHFDLPIVPIKEYKTIITNCYESKKAEFKDKPSEKPLYLKSKLDTLLKKMKQINKEGCYKFHHASSTNRCYYNRCIQLATDAGIHILYTKLDHEISFIDDVCFHKDLYRVFGATADDFVADEINEKASVRNKFLTPTLPREFISAVEKINITHSFIPYKRNIPRYIDNRFKGYVPFKKVVPYHRLI